MDPSRPVRRTVTRRLLLRDLGRATLGAVVLGVTASACDDGGAGDGATSPSTPDSSTGSPTSGSTATGSPTDTASSTDPGSPAATAGGGLVWERASFGFVSAYVLVRAGEAMVFDTGTGEDGVEPITAALEAAGVAWGDVAHVLVSHEHGDHLGGIEAVMAEATAATAYASGPDFASLQSRVDGAQEVADGDEVLAVRVVATPGHTPGHVSAFDPDSGLLLAGDAIVNGVQIGGTSGTGIELSPPEFTADGDAAASSATTLADLAPSTILFGHGDPVTEDAAGQLTELTAA